MLDVPERWPKDTKGWFGRWCIKYEVLTQSDLSEEVNLFNILHTTVTDARLEELKIAMRLDQDMQILIRLVESGWSNKRQFSPREIHAY